MSHETEPSFKDGIAYARGRFVGLDEAVIPVEDRAHQFGDGIYEVIRVYHGYPFLLEEHLARFERSAAAIGLKLERPMDELRELVFTAIERAGLPQAQVYFQLSRGIVKREHGYPAVPGHLSMTVRPVVDERFHAVRENGQRVIFAEDIRWKYCYIKSLNLLPNVMVKQRALDAGVNDAIFVANGVVTEGTSSNVGIVSTGMLVTHPADERILHGVTRGKVLALAQQHGIPVREEKFSPADLLKADEVFMMSSVTELVPVVEVNGQPVGMQTLRECSVLRRLQRLYKEEIARTCAPAAMRALSR